MTNLSLENLAQTIFSVVIALKMVSKAGAHSVKRCVNCAFSTIFALPQRKIYIVQSSLIFKSNLSN